MENYLNIFQNICWKYLTWAAELPILYQILLILFILDSVLLVYDHLLTLFSQQTSYEKCCIFCALSLFIILKYSNIFSININQKLEIDLDQIEDIHLLKSEIYLKIYDRV